MRVAILSNDVVPGMGLPVAAPGLRAWGLALGLRAHGHEVSVLLDLKAVRAVWEGGEQPAVPPSMPSGTVLITAQQATAWVREHGIEVLVIINSNLVRHLGDLGPCRLVYDFFAPKMLEMAENTLRENAATIMDSLEQRKLYALGRSDGVVVNGAKKVPYVREWLQRAGVPDLPLEVVNPALPPVAPDPADTERLQVMVSGYIQPWSRPGAWAEAILPLLDQRRVVLHLVVGNHWAKNSREAVMSPEVARLAAHPGVRQHGLMTLTDFRTLLSRCHLSIDVFERNPERELAMVTRTVVALTTGLPAMHVDFTEVSPWIAEQDAGWLVDEDDVDGMRAVLSEAAADRSVLEPKRAGAVRLSTTVLEPGTAAEPFDRLLRSLR
ncbi:hypothetical protein GCM10023340_31430 [Nocardioides marinquilinus]|uniref:Uncharacterized protein n=1 Tax=Nocardioides marinquilinus TaxID=1210400 RepID=A0ABP9PYI2_9ACTN